MDSSFKSVFEHKRHRPLTRALQTIPVLFGSVAFLLMAPPTQAEDHYGIVVETANSYSSCFGNGTNLSNSDQSGSNFLNQMLSVNPLGFSTFAHWQDASVWDTDFLDPDTSGANSRDDDTYNFDESGLAISFFQGHGLVSIKPAQDQICTSGSQCTNPPGGASGPGACVLSPSSAAKYGTGKGVCQYSSNRAMVTCGTGDANGHLAFLSPNMAFGETPSNGSWRGAGTNGGTSLAIVHMSFGMMTFFPGEWSSIFAGLHLYEGMMVSWGDVNDSLAYGNAVAQPYSVNPSSSVSAGYLSAISSVTDGGGCNGATSWGGGFNGCGCHMVMTLSPSNQIVQETFYENWFSLKYDVGQTGVGYWWYGANCNYNPAAYPWNR